MKKVIFTDQLDLSKEVIADLTEEQLKEIEGGAGADGSCSGGGNSCIRTQVVDSPAVSED